MIDDKINGALVCLDVNANNWCDPGELTATTMNNGNFTLSNVPAANANAPLVAMVDSTAIIVPANGGAQTPFGNRNVVFSAPGGQKDAAGNQHITPFTTMVDREQKRSGGTVASSIAIVKQKLGLGGNGVDVLGDYTAVAAADPYAAEKAKLLKVAQVGTQIIADNYANIAAGAGGSAAVNVFAASIDYLMNNLSTVSYNVDVYSKAGAFNVATLAQTIPLATAGGVTAKQLVTNASAQATQLAANALSLATIRQAFSQGVNSIWGTQSTPFITYPNMPNIIPPTTTFANYSINKLKLAANGVNSNQMWSAGGSFVNNYTGWQANGWQANNYTGWQINPYGQVQEQFDPVSGQIALTTATTNLLATTLNANGSVTFSTTHAPVALTLSDTVRGFSVTGQTFASVLNVAEHGNGWSVPWVPTTTFTSPNAQAFDVTETVLTDAYTINTWNDPLQCQQYGVPYTPTTNCSVVRMVGAFGSIVSNTTTGQMTPAATLADLIVVDPYALLVDPYQIAVLDPYVVMLDPYASQGIQILATSKAATSGMIRYYDRRYLTTYGSVLVDVVPWTIQNVAGGRQMLYVAYSPVIKAFLNATQGFADSGEFYITNNGFVYSGWFNAAGSTATWRMFNNDALFDLKNAIAIPSPLGAP